MERGAAAVFSVALDHYKLWLRIAQHLTAGIIDTAQTWNIFGRIVVMAVS